MINLPAGKSKEEVIEHCSREITESRDYVQNRRVEFRDRLRLYNNLKKKKNKQGDTLIYDLMNTALSIYYVDKMQIKFSGRNNLSTDRANWLDKLAQFDHDEMDMDKKDYLVQWDRLFYGVGIKLLGEWNERTKCPIARSIDTLSWLPDPHGHSYMENFRYMGFEVTYNEYDLQTISGMTDKKSEDILGEYSVGNEQELNRDAHDTARNLNSPRGEDDYYDMIDLFTCIDEEKYIITLDSECKSIVRCEMLEPVTAEEKKDHSLIPFPVSLHYYSPLRNDPFGVSLCDLSEDKQRGIAILKNLRLEFTQSQLYPMYLYNRDKIKNKRDLDFDFNKFVGVSGGIDGNIGGVVEPMNKAMINTNAVYNDEMSLRADAEKATGVNQIIQGFVMKDATLGESQQAQANANLRMMLGTLVNNWGEVRFWKLWYRLYQANQPKDKQIRIKTSIGLKYYTVKKDDFLGIEDPDIEIISKIEADRKKNNDRLNFMQVYPIIAQDPTRPLISKKYAERKMFRLNNVDDDEISIMSPKTKDEVRAENENLILENEHIDVKEEEDHLTHIVIHSQMIPNKFLEAHMAKHWAMYEESGQAERDARLQQMNQMNQMGKAQSQGNGMANSINQQAIAAETQNNSLETNQSI